MHPWESDIVSFFHQLAFKLIDPKAYHRTSPLTTQVPEDILESTKNSNEPAPKGKDLENTELSFQNLSVSSHTSLLVKATPSAGTSSMMSVAREDTGGVVQKFANSGEEDTDVPQEKEVPKKKVVRKKVIRKVKKRERSITSVPLMEKGLGDV
jgi:hypothetical protein